jgi:hypothetical protein
MKSFGTSKCDNHLKCRFGYWVTTTNYVLTSMIILKGLMKCMDTMEEYPSNYPKDIMDQDGHECLMCPTLN